MRKIIDEKGRFFGLISFIDVIVAAVVILLAITVFTKFGPGDTLLGASNTREVTYTVKIFGIRDSNANLLLPGDKLYAADTEAVLGTIREVEINSAFSVEPTVDGTYVKAKVEDRLDVILTIDAQCSFSNDRYYCDRTYELNGNAEVWMHTKYSEVHGTIMTIMEAGANKG